MVTSVNLIYSDVTTEEGYRKAFGWLKYYHWRYALLIKWMDNVGGYFFYLAGTPSLSETFIIIAIIFLSNRR